MKGISQLINRLYENINIYDNTIDIFTTQFISPVADAAPTFYMYFIRDTSHRGWSAHRPAYTFTPRNPEDLLFRGYLYINIDDNYAVHPDRAGRQQKHKPELRPRIPGQTGV
jgi:hypothetical protein